MPTEDDDQPRKKISHEIGQDLHLLSLEELTERVALLNAEIERLQQAAGKKRASKDAASAFFPSPFEEAAILTLDGVGEWSTCTIGVGSGNRLRLEAEMEFPHSLGLLYSAFTYYCGFRVNSGEYKLMGLAPYGKPVYRDLILRHLIDLKPDGSFWMDMEFFNYCHGLTMTNARGRLRIKDQRVTLDDFAVSTLGGQIGVTGFYETTVPTKPTVVGIRLEGRSTAAKAETSMG